MDEEEQEEKTKPLAPQKHCYRNGTLTEKHSYYDIQMETITGTQFNQPTASQCAIKDIST